ncbi:MAG: heme ABC transporter permease [Gammaproteobacteria bacterium]|nr:heme ABC transporter permease [Gammaproteobacteria bacterium]
MNAFTALEEKSLKQLASPREFYRISGYCLPWLWIIFAAAFIFGVFDGLWLAPGDYQQGHGYRIMFVHVPAAMLSLGVYCLMAGNALVYLVWKIKLADVIAAVSAPLGALFTALALLTGALWGKPMWGTWWIWDARLTSELILLFLYFGVIGLRSAIPDQDRASKATSILLLVGVIDLPIIHYSVYWWNTLHQQSTLLKLGSPSIAPSMLYPLLAMIIAFSSYFAAVLLMSVRNELLRRERHTHWVGQVLKG